MIKRIGGLLLALALVLLSAVAVLWSVSRSAGPQSEVAAALDALDERWRPEGRNALSGLWLMDYAIPDRAQRDSVLRDDLRKLHQSQVLTARVVGPDISTAEGRFPLHLYGSEDRGQFCKVTDACLQRVRTDLKRYRDLIARNQAALKQLGEADDGDHLQGRFETLPNMVLQPRYAQAYYPATELAVRFLDGEREAALDQTCRHIVRWRQLRQNTDSMETVGVAASFAARGYGQLAGDMLGEWPLTQPLPKVCDIAFQPPGSPEVQGLCRGMQGEFRTMAAELRRAVPAAGEQRKGPGWLRYVPHAIVYDAEKTAARLAPHYAQYCQTSAQRAYIEDRDLEQPLSGRSDEVGLACVANLAGCLLIDPANLDLSEQVVRLRHADAQLRLLGALQWLRAQPGIATDPAATLAQLPPHLTSAAHPVRYDAATRSLVMQQLGAQQAAGVRPNTVTMPLPGSRVPVSTPVPPPVVDQVNGVPNDAALPEGAGSAPVDAPAAEPGPAAPSASTG